ncbi:methionine--tRNA ligase [Oleiagrimonas sp. C23AA]|uniref:methionine--tRNA ligase n=1 Tax=Oleiagrimonas sp. C23AA TaxID=2719047 RepID=UPI001422AED7|nr:methionine--tRNA ligase [Oleiagrimonas sp. C23AA]NII10105.1 methionine--tRNA ligase [Oleiagrimonas sp. C23AA]
MSRRILVTCALPYANGPIHIGHMVEHVQGDIWVRAMRMAGHEVHFVCADDAHGTPIMLRAEREGITPESLIEQSNALHRADFNDFGIAYDHYSTTNSDANKALTYRIYNALRDAGHVESKAVTQFYDPDRGMFLPDRFVKGECPHCHAKDQYGDSCEVCGKTYTPTDLIEPYSVVTGARPVQKASQHYFVRLADFESMLRAWLSERREAGGLQGEVVNKLEEWFADGLRSWDVSRDAPYFGFEIPDAPGKFFYVWLDAPVGYFASFREFCEEKGLDFDAFIERDAAQKAGTELVHFIGKDIIYFHTLFWPAMLHGAGLRTPTAVNVHGFLTVDGAKMSKSRGTFINARTYLEQLDPDYLRYYLAAMLGPTLTDVDLDLKAFEERCNSHLVGKWVNIASRCSGFLAKFFDGKLTDTLRDDLAARYRMAAERLAPVAGQYERRDYAAAMRTIMAVADDTNAWIAECAPWKMAKDESLREDLHQVCSLAINLFRLLSAYLKPVVPATVARAETFLALEAAHFDDVTEPLCGHQLAPFQPLLTRVDAGKIAAMLEASRESLKPAAAPAAPQAKKTPMTENASPAKDDAADEQLPTITIDDFAKLDLRIGKVTVCEAVEGSNKLLRFELDAGELGTRQIFSGIKAAYGEPEKLVGRNVVFVANLAPRKMRFGLSEGMILSAGSGGDDLFLLDADAGVTPGAPVR